MTGCLQTQPGNVAANNLSALRHSLRQSTTQYEWEPMPAERRGRQAERISSRCCPAQGCAAPQPRSALGIITTVVSLKS